MVLCRWHMNRRTNGRSCVESKMAWSRASPEPVTYRTRCCAVIAHRGQHEPMKARTREDLRSISGEWHGRKRQTNRGGE